ncbi:MAG: alpha/beta hydrolase [Acidimicrobiales bacterium]
MTAEADIAIEAGPADLDPGRFVVHRFDGRGFSQAYVRENPGGVPLLLVHGWPETKRIWWRVIEPLAAAGFEVIVPDLRGFGDSDVGPDGFHDVPAHSRDLQALLTEGLGHDRVVLAGGDLGGPVIQDLALRFPELADRLVLFNAPVPGIGRHPGSVVRSSAHDYFVRQGTDADALAAELGTPAQRRAYVATFYSSRFWAHDGAFDTAAIDFHTEPFADAAHLRAGFGVYESTFDPAARSERALIKANPDVRVLILYGPDDHVIPSRFDLDAAAAFADHVGPFLLRDCGHFVPWEAPHAFVSATVSYCGDLLADR